MKLLIIVSLVIIFSFVVLKKSVSFLKINLIRAQRVWSGEDIKINRKDLNKNISTSSNNTKNNYLEVIADESKIFLDEQS